MILGWLIRLSNSIQIFLHYIIIHNVLLLMFGLGDDTFVHLVLKQHNSRGGKVQSFIAFCAVIQGFIRKVQKGEANRKYTKTYRLSNIKGHTFVVGCFFIQNYKNETIYGS